MFNGKLFVSLAIASIFYSSTAHSLEIADTKAPDETVFVSVQNATLSSLSIAFSSGESVDLQKDTGKLFPCSDTQGLVMFVNPESGTSDLSVDMLCGHSYTVKENAQ